MAHQEDQEKDSPRPGRVIAPGETIASLQQANAMLRGTIESAPDLIAVEDTSARYLAFNHAYHAEFKKVFGVDLTIGASMIEALAHLPEEQQATTELFERTMRGEEFTVTHEFGDKRLERRSYEIHCFPLRDSEGRLLGGTHIAHDVTERRRAQEALRASEERLKLAQYAGHVGIFDWDITADQAVITGELEAIFGLARGVERSTYQNWTRYVHPEDQARLNAAFQQCLQARQRQANVEYRIIRPDGPVRWVEVKGQISYLDTGVPARMIGTIVDVTERKRAEEALRESEMKFRALAENARACFGIVQGQRFVYANPWFAQISGYSVDEILTMDFPQLTHPDFRPLMEERARRRQMGESIPNHYDFAMLTKSGEKRWVEFSVATIEYRGQPAIIGTGFDITERKRAEEALRLRNERLALLSEAATHLLKAENQEMMIRELFEKVARHLDLQGYMNFMVNEAGDALRLDSYAGIPEAAARKVQRLEFGQELCGTVAQLGQAIYVPDIQQSSDEKVQMVKNLGIRAYACNPLMVGGRLLGTLAFATSSRDRFSEDELEFMRTICQYVAVAKERLRLEGELRGHIERLAEADRRKDEFLAMMAHELRNPLAPIRNAAQVLRLVAPQEAILKRQREIIDRQVTHWPGFWTICWTSRASRAAILPSKRKRSGCRMCLPAPWSRPTR